MIVLDMSFSSKVMGHLAHFPRFEDEWCSRVSVAVIAVPVSMVAAGFGIRGLQGGGTGRARA
jgi:hypothetical protein